MKQAQSEAYCLRTRSEAVLGNSAHGGRAGAESACPASEPSPAEIASCQTAARNRRWNLVVDCEARNALQVILSGSEVLLDRSCRMSAPDQKDILERILASAHHLNSIIATLSRSDDLICAGFAEAADGEFHVTWRQPS